MLFLFVIILTIINSIHTQSVQPVFQCYFETYNDNTATRTYNLVMGYTNSDSSNDVIIAVDTNNQNTITPLDYNGVQPYIFKPGSNLFVITIVDTLSVLHHVNASGITWTLTSSQTVTITHETVTLSSNQCNIKYEGNCPLNIEGFCEDGLYCNGQESCFSNVISTDPSSIPGLCVQSSEPIECSSNHECDESLMSCKSIPTSPPPTTEEPTTSVPTTSVPVPEPTTLEPIPEPTTLVPIPGPTTLVPVPVTVPVAVPNVEGSCVTNQDCSILNSFCHGPYICSQETHQCVQYDPNYSPCSIYENNLKEFYNLIGHDNNTQGGIIYECIEHIQQCIEVFYCDSNDDCDDGNICNGEETCNGSVCVSALDHSIEQICGSSSSHMGCTKERGCFVIQYTSEPNSTAGIIVVSVLAACIGFIVILAMIWAIMAHYKFHKKERPQPNDQKVQKKKAKKTRKRF